MKKAVLAFSFLLFIALVSVAGATGPQKPGARDRCPVCGMFVAKYPAWTASITFKDGSRVFFDGPKDMFAYYLDLPKYNNNASVEDVADIYVTEYYSARPVDAKVVFFIAGSDVLGPMGYELIPIQGQQNAKGFMKDHHGKKILTFNDISRTVISDLQ